MFLLGENERRINAGVARFRLVLQSNKVSEEMKVVKAGRRRV